MVSPGTSPLSPSHTRTYHFQSRQEAHFQVKADHFKSILLMGTAFLETWHRAMEDVTGHTEKAIPHEHGNVNLKHTFPSHI